MSIRQILDSICINMNEYGQCFCSEAECKDKVTGKCMVDGDGEDLCNRYCPVNDEWDEDENEWDEA